MDRALRGLKLFEFRGPALGKKKIEKLQIQNGNIYLE
jgi:hypothetical protein